VLGDRNASTQANARTWLGFLRKNWFEVLRRSREQVGAGHDVRPRDGRGLKSRFDEGKDNAPSGWPERLAKVRAQALAKVVK